MAKKKEITGLYDKSFEKDSCGFGLITNIDNKPSHWLIDTAITALERLAHRGAVGADGTSGDGCGILFKIPEFFFRSIANEQKINLAKDFAIGMFFLSKSICHSSNIVTYNSFFQTRINFIQVIFIIITWK